MKSFDLHKLPQENPVEYQTSLFNQSSDSSGGKLSGKYKHQFKTKFDLHYYDEEDIEYLGSFI